MKTIRLAATSLLVLALAACASEPAPPQQIDESATQKAEVPADETEAATGNKPDAVGPSWQLGEFVQVAPEGVSAHIAALETGYRIAYGSYNAGGWVVQDCSFEWICETTGQLDRVADLTVVTLVSGESRAYFVEINPESRQKEIFTAAISEDWLTLSERKSIGFDDGGALAWGVPDAVVTPEGLVRVYWVVPGDVMASERVISATSTDATGTEFSLDPGDRLEGGYVDFEVVRAAAGDWLGIASSSPEGLPLKPQGLFVASSADGLKWTIDDTSVSPQDMSYLDPTAVIRSDGALELVISRASNELGPRTYELVRTSMELTE